LLEPKLLLLDEPTKGMDALCKENMGKILRELTAEGATILMVTHEHDLVRHLGGRIININSGEVVFDEVIGGNNEA
jgi:ABC-type multidrug transport system ATPase subunit